MPVHQEPGELPVGKAGTHGRGGKTGSREEKVEDEGGGDGEARGGGLPYRLREGQGGSSGRTAAPRPWPLNQDIQ